ncbi:MAG: hypothetical protein V4646_03710 [Pseudomonadota bacterium]
MTSLPGKPLFCIGLLLASCFWLAGCVGTGEFAKSKDARPVFLDANMSVQEAQAAITIGTSTKADVRAALGAATVVKFDSAYEVWVYRGKDGKATTTGAEFVILFAPSGIVKKTRIRPPSDRPAE